MSLNAAGTDARPMSCLRHGEFHVMEQECWNTTLEFWFEWQELLTPQQLKDRYDQEVERKMLNDFIERLAPKWATSVKSSQYRDTR